MKVFNKTKNKYLTKVKLAKTIKDRLIGLMFSKKIEGGLILEPCQSIHTCFMNYAIDVAFLDKDYQVIKIVRNLKPWRFTRFYFKARRVLEMNAYSMQELDEGDQLQCLN